MLSILNLPGHNSDQRPEMQQASEDESFSSWLQYVPTEAGYSLCVIRDLVLALSMEVSYKAHIVNLAANYKIQWLKIDFTLLELAIFFKLSEADIRQRGNSEHYAFQQRGSSPRILQ